MALSYDWKIGNSGGSNNVTQSWSQAAAAGDLLIAAYTGQFSATVTIPSGWTSLIANSASFCNGLAYKWATGGETSFEFLLSTGSNLTVTAVRVTGLSQAAWVANTNYSSDVGQAGTTTLATTSLTANAGQQPIFFGLAECATSASLNTPGGYSSQGTPVSASSYPGYAFLANALTTASQVVNPSTTTTGTTLGYGNAFLILLTPLGGLPLLPNLAAGTSDYQGGLAA